VLANVEVDQEHWLTAGVNNKLIGMLSGNNLAWFASEKEILASGYLWQENKAQMAYKPFLIHQPMDRRFVISFTQNPTDRAYLDGLNVLLMNSIFRAAAHATPLR